MRKYVFNIMLCIYGTEKLVFRNYYNKYLPHFCFVCDSQKHVIIGNDQLAMSVCEYLMALPNIEEMVLGYYIAEMSGQRISTPAYI